MPVTDLAVFAYYWMRTGVARIVRSERGEGVISTALVVLIMAALAAAMWVAMETLWDTTESKTTDLVADIGD